MKNYLFSKVNMTTLMMVSLLIVVYSPFVFGATLGQIFVEVQVQRNDGVGSCGKPPWGVDHIEGGDFTCVPPKYWYGYDLLATAFQNVQITPAGNGTWSIAGANKGGGTYQKAEHWSDGERVCSPVSTTGEDFDFEVDGTYQDGKITLDVSALPVETSNWACDNDYTYVRETTLLLIDLSTAITGDYTSCYITLDDADQVRTGEYEHEYSADMNPSPENRDNVSASVDFKCVELSEGAYVPIACPWETSEDTCPSEAIYGEYSEQTELLRHFRDNVLSQTPEGQAIIRLYYEWGPAIVKAIEEDEEFKEQVKEMIDGVLGLIVGEVE